MSAFRWLTLLLGTAIVAIGALHIVFGLSFIRGVTQVNASLDSEDRFFGAIFLGYGLAWLWCAGSVETRLTPIRPRSSF